MNSACFHVRIALARSTRSIRSVLVQAGRFTYRRRMIRGFRRNAFSATSSDLLLARSVSVQSRERGGVRFGPGDEAVVERLKAKAYQTRDEGENPIHSVRYPFVKMNRGMHLAFYPTSGESARCERHGKVFSKASSDGQIPQVASTGASSTRIRLPFRLVAPISKPIAWR